VEVKGGSGLLLLRCCRCLLVSQAALLVLCCTGSRLFLLLHMPAAALPRVKVLML
jgi:hypothetical protein